MCVNVAYIYTKSHIRNNLVTILLSYENIKKKKYLDLFLDQWQIFSHFFILIDAICGRKVTTLVIIMDLNLSCKWQHPYCYVCGSLNVRMLVSILQATGCCILGYGVPCTNSNCWLPQWEYVAGLVIFLCEVVIYEKPKGTNTSPLTPKYCIPPLKHLTHPPHRPMKLLYLAAMYTFLVNSIVTLNLHSYFY